VRSLVAAGDAPRGPEVEQHDLAAVGRKAKLAAVVAAIVQRKDERKGEIRRGPMLYALRSRAEGVPEGVIAHQRCGDRNDNDDHQLSSGLQI
jgi:hypothetical protein